jgi:hypothetical protein
MSRLCKVKIKYGSSRKACFLPRAQKVEEILQALLGPIYAIRPFLSSFLSLFTSLQGYPSTSDDVKRRSRWRICTFDVRSQVIVGHLLVIPLESVLPEGSRIMKFILIPLPALKIRLPGDQITGCAGRHPLLTPVELHSFSLLLTVVRISAIRRGCLIPHI